ncbi:IS3 family transposase [Streptomyces sp. NPDC055254]
MLIKTEGLRDRTFTTRAEANLALFEYVDGFYNSRRIQERLGFLSPIEFEEEYYADQATVEPANPEHPSTPIDQLISNFRATGNLTQPGPGDHGWPPGPVACPASGQLSSSVGSVSQWNGSDLEVGADLY